jgi:hypothetical protein
MAAMAVGVLVATAGAAGAQTKTLEGEAVTATVTIEAIEQSSRTMTVKDSKGIYETVDVPRELTRFSELKVGDKITARYYENVVVRLKKPGEAAVDVSSDAVTKSGRPGGTAATQRTITATVTARDPKTRSVTVSGPNGYTYSRKIADKKAFEALQVGERIDMTWTNALLLSVDSPKK